MAQGTLTGTTVRPEELYTNIVKAGVSPAEAAIVVGNWIVVNAGGTPRFFSYRTAFPSTDPGCAPQFARSFVHQDWVDGEDVVQAEQTTGEEGFNLRFHRIEGDLDALGRDVAKLFVCMAEMRAALRVLLDELSTEINLINRQLAERTGPIIRGEGPIIKGPKYVGTTRYFGKKVNIFETEAGTFVLPGVEEVEAGPLVNPRVDRVREIARFATKEEVLKFFGQTTKAVTKQQFLTKFGNEKLESGVTIREALEILPGTSRFDNADELVDRVADREGRALRTSGVEDEAIEAQFGLEPGGTVKEAPIDRFGAVPTDGRTALANAGIATMGELVRADADKLAVDLQRGGINVSKADVHGWVAVAKTLTKVK